MRLILKLAPILLLSACTSNLQELRSVSPKTEGFSGSLASEYLAYSESEAEQGRSSSAEYFASKGLKASKGEAVEPDNVNDKIANSNLLKTYRSAFVEILTDNLKKIAPSQAARTQLLFDCLNDQENNKLSFDNPFYAAGESAVCGDEFVQMYDGLREVSDKLVYGEDNQQMIRFFEGSAELDSEERNIIKEIAIHLRKHKNSTLSLSTPTDDKLAQKRLANVRSALIKAGVSKDRIAIEKSQAKDSAAVVLSNDIMMQNKDKVDVIITSPQHVAVVSHD